MSELLLPREAIVTVSPIKPELPQSRQLKKDNADTTEIKVVSLSPEDQQLAALPEELAEIIFANLASKNISAL
jgi:hypothetical protein